MSRKACGTRVPRWSRLSVRVDTRSRAGIMYKLSSLCRLLCSSPAPDLEAVPYDSLRCIKVIESRSKYLRPRLRRCCRRGRLGEPLANVAILFAWCTHHTFLLLQQFLLMPIGLHLAVKGHSLTEQSSGGFRGYMYSFLTVCMIGGRH